MQIMAKKVKRLALASALIAAGSGGMAYGASTQDLQRQIDDLRNQVEKEAGKLSINGFLSAGVAGSDVSSATRSTGINEDISFISDSVVGVQLDFNMTDDTKATVQLVGRGLENFNSNVEWAYLSHSFSDNFSMKAGRLRIPAYMTSEYIEVGMAYPWVRPAPEVYDLVFFTYYDGAAFTYDFSTGSVDSSLQVLTGNASGLDSNNAATADIDFEIDAKLGLTYVANMGDWRFNLAYFKTDILSDDLGPDLSALIALLTAIGIEEKKLAFDELELDYVNVGLNYDNGDWIFHAEGALITAESLFSENKAYFVSLARRIGAWTPYIMYAEMENINNDEIDDAAAGIIAAQPLIALADPTFTPAVAAATATGFAGSFKEAQKSTYVGVGYNLTPKVKLKAEWRYVEVEDDTKGTFDFAEFAADPFEHANVYSLVLDAVF